VRGLIVLGILVVVAVAAALVTIRNSDPVTIDLLFTSLPSVPLWGVLAGSFLLGAVLVAAILSWPYARLRLRVRSQSRQIARLEQEIHGLRTLPLPDETTNVREG
jgi:uncharacterized membrane protein YciS (DUF1049 family)